MDRRQIISVVSFVLIFMLLMSIFTGRTGVVDVQEQENEMVLSDEISSLYKAVEKGETEGTFRYETNVFDITFDKKGASVQSLALKNHADADGNYSDMVFRTEEDNNAFLLYWGDDYENPVQDVFAVSVDGDRVVFTKDYQKADGSTFTLVKTFEFRPDDYLISVSVDVLGSELTEGDYAYTLAYEPQVGPAFSKMGNNNYDYRRFYAGVVNEKNGKVKRSNVRLSSNYFMTTKDLDWISLSGKYFTVIARPADNTVSYKYRALQGAGGIAQTDGIYVSVPSDVTAESTVYFYCGPQLKQYLGSYYNGSDNQWGLRNLNLDDAMESRSALSWLENILKWCLTMLYKVIPNYGVGIILLTVLLKIILWPIQQKGTTSTAKMSALGPKLKEIQDKYPNNPQKQNEETTKLYRENGVSPLGGCLPLLVQFPILIAFYGLLNKHFELRGAMFIPGWIPDLSVPETIFRLGFNIPLLGNEIHLLPFLYTASMIFSMKFTQSSTPQSSEQQGTMKFMTYWMPLIFFFVLYAAPSGLLLYWSVQNFLSILQQIYTNAQMKKGAYDKKSPVVTKNEPKAVLEYQEKLKKREEAKKGKK